MTLDQAKIAVSERVGVQLKSNPDRWGIASCLSDCETLMYFKNGAGGSGSAMIEHLEFSFDWTPPYGRYTND